MKNSHNFFSGDFLQSDLCPGLAIDDRVVHLLVKPLRRVIPNPAQQPQGIEEGLEGDPPLSWSAWLFLAVGLAATRTSRSRGSATAPSLQGCFTSGVLPPGAGQHLMPRAPQDADLVVWLANLSRHQPESQCLICLCMNAQPDSFRARKDRKCSDFAFFMLPANTLKCNGILIGCQNRFVILSLKSTRVQYCTRSGRTSLRRSAP